MDKKILLNEYQIDELLGKGGFSNVYKSHRIKTHDLENCLLQLCLLVATTQSSPTQLPRSRQSTRIQTPLTSHPLLFRGSNAPEEQEEVRQEEVPCGQVGGLHQKRRSRGLAAPLRRPGPRQ